MWKESYQVGVERIDQQHYKLFSMVEGLLNIIKAEVTAVRKREYRAAFAFMKAYVVEHFADEEAYQVSIGYLGLEGHKRLHREFTQGVLAFEKRFLASDFADTEVKEFAGMLVSWLIYHVIREDQKIPKQSQPTDGAEEAVSKPEQACVQYFGKGASEVLAQMAGITGATMGQGTVSGKIAGDLFVEVELVGDIQGRAIFGFSSELAFALIKAMTFMEMTKMDELVCSAMAEISNIISGNAATQLTKGGLQCDIKPPVVRIGAYEADRIDGDAEVVFIDTGIGRMQVTVIGGTKI